MLGQERKNLYAEIGKEREMPTEVEIGSAGESVVNAWLIKNGYRTNLDTRQPGSVDIVAVKPLIEAVGSQASLLVQVKTALSPNTPADISSDELRNINAQAARLGFHSWLAQVVVDSNLRPIGDIAWRKLTG